VGYRAREEALREAAKPLCTATASRAPVAIKPALAFAGALTAITAAVVGVVLNLSIWFDLHTLFRQTVEVRGLALSFDAPVFSSVDVPALALSIAAATAIFRFNVGMLTVLAASCVARVLLRLTGLI